MIDAIPIVSVGMPVYNGQEFLRDSIQSILEQTFTDFELIISDNASTDETPKICQEFAAGDPRVRYYRNPENVGASDNYNAVFRHARGAYFKWASGNDLCERTFLEKCVAALDRRPDAVLAYPRTRLVYGGSTPAEDYIENLDLDQESACERFKLLLKRIRLNNVMNGLIRSRALRRTPLIKPYYSSDTVLMAEVVLYGKFVEVPEYLFYRRMDSKAATAMKSEDEVLEHYDPKKRKPMMFQNWKHSAGTWGAVWRAPLPIAEKFCLYPYALRRGIQDRNELAGDIREAMRYVLGRRRSAS